MNTSFIFSDETGSYEPKSFVRVSGKVKYFVRSAVTIDASEWRTLKDGFALAKARCGLKPIDEGKWSHCWSAISAKRTNTKIKNTKPYIYFDSISEAEILKYIEDCLECISKLASVAVFLICSKNQYTRHTTLCIEKWHIQNLMQRSQMEVSRRGADGLGIIFFDPIEPVVETRLRNIYNALYLSGDFVAYTNLKDSLNFEISHHSVGIQAADIIAGCFNGALKGHREAVDLFNRHLLPKLRRHPTLGNIKGCGIVSVPRGAIEPELTALGIAR